MGYDVTGPDPDAFIQSDFQSISGACQSGSSRVQTCCLWRLTGRRQTLGFELKTFHLELKEAPYPALLHTALLNDQAAFLLFGYLILIGRHSVMLLLGYVLFLIPLLLQSHSAQRAF